MRKTNEGASPVRPVLFGATAGLLATLVLMLVCAVLVHQGTLGEELIPTISLACRSPSDSVAQPSVCSVQSRLRCSALLPASICVQKTNTVI